jgi:hypothetical protein
MIKNLTAKVFASPDKLCKSFSVSGDLPIDKMIVWDTISEIRQEVIKEIAQIWLRENGDIINTEILNNPNFTNALYNAIVLKKTVDLPTQDK